MSRFANFCRIAAGLFLFGDIPLFFLPVTTITQENYPTEVFTPFSYVCSVFNYDINQLKTAGSDLAIIMLMLFPVLLALIIGSALLISREHQIICGIGSVFILLLNVICYTQLNGFAPERLNDAQVYSSGYGIITLLFSTIATILGIIGMVLKPRRKRAVAEETIPDVAVIRQEQIMPKYEFIDEAMAPAAENESVEGVSAEPVLAADIQSTPIPPAPATPQGVMVGMTGIYQGARIPFHENETLHLGRGSCNDLIFTDAPKVSRVHCAITWMAAEQRYKILDKSTNGCFVNGMEDCIPQNIELYLEPGTILDIGDSANRFRLD